jgi:hypothetical protein
VAPLTGVDVGPDRPDRRLAADRAHRVADSTGVEHHRHSAEARADKVGPRRRASSAPLDPRVAVVILSGPFGSLLLTDMGEVARGQLSG